jgi:hypothetical protein
LGLLRYYKVNYKIIKSREFIKKEKNKSLLVDVVDPL